MILVSVLIVCVATAIALPTRQEPDTLVLLHVLFRHGDRTPEMYELYPKDPYQAEKYFLEGFGELTKKGKRREYQTGKDLRRKYNSFLGKYKSSQVSALSTDYSRTKMSCLLVLAGLYPPEQSQKWDAELNWQPIPYSEKDYPSDYILGDPSSMCPKFIKGYEQFFSIEGDKIYNKNAKLYDYVSLHSGLKIKGPKDIYNLQFTLNSEESLGLELPLWLKSVWPENITHAATEEYYLAHATPQLKRLAGGALLQKIINDTKNKVVTNSTDEHKLYIYSGHENNIAYQLLFFDALYPHIPPYGSYIVTEIHKINNVYGVKLFYENFTERSGYIKIPNCDWFCPINKFEELMKDNLPTNEDTCKL